MAKYRVAVIGLGRIGAQLENDTKREHPVTHLGGWLAHDDRCEIVGVCDTDETRLSQSGNARGFTDYEDMMNQVRPDIVSVATPDTTHSVIARVVMRYDPVKLVFLEKPIATNLDDAQKIIDTAREFRVKLAVNHTRRWDPIWQHAAKLCSEEQPVNMTGYFTGDAVRDGTHMADLVNWFTPKNHQIIKGTTDYLLFEADLFWQNRRLRITDNGRSSKMYLPFNSQHYEGFKELAMTCQTTRSLYPETSMYLATEQLLDVLDAETGKETGSTIPLCTGEQAKKALELALTWA